MFITMILHKIYSDAWMWMMIVMREIRALVQHNPSLHQVVALKAGHLYIITNFIIPINFGSIKTFNIHIHSTDKILF